MENQKNKNENGSVIQDIGRPDFEDVLRTGALWRSFMTPIASTLTLGPLWLAQVASQNPGGGVPLRGAAEQAKLPALSSGGFGLREGPKSYPAVFHAILGTNLLMRL